MNDLGYHDNALLEAHIGHVTERIRDLKLLERQLRQSGAARTSPRVVKRLRIVLGLAGTAAHGPGHGDRHIKGAHAVRKGKVT